MTFPGQTEQLWSQIWDAVADIVEVSDADSRLVYASRSLETNYGIAAEGAIGRRLSDLVRSEVHSDEFYEDVWNTISHGGVWRGRMVSKARDGRLIHQDAIVSPVIGADGNNKRFVPVKRVINAQLLSELRLRKQEQLAA
jgi:PAS domain S-box-containing protein